MPKFYVMQQLPLGISPAAEPAFENFVAGPNAEALARVRELAQGALSERIVYLWGNTGSGRTQLFSAAPGSTPSLAAADDVQLLDRAAQPALFVAFQRPRDAGPCVLVAGDKPPAQL